jgi:hypothetical protein
MHPRIAEFNNPFEVVFLRRYDFFPAKTIMKSTRVDVREAIVSIGRIPSSPRQILKAVGTVDQKIIARQA